MSFELVNKYSKHVDELFVSESKKELLTNTDFDWSGNHTVVVWKVSTVGMNDYARNVYGDEEPEHSAVKISRFGELYDLSKQTEELLLKKDRSFIFNIDKMDKDETGEAVEEASALARQIREVVIPEVDKYTYGVMAKGAGAKAEVKPLTEENIYDAILTGSEFMDDQEVPETERVLVVTPATYTILKQAVAFDHTDVGTELKLNGVLGYLDGMKVVKVPSNRLPEGFGFMIAHPSATVAPVKLEDYGIHRDTPISSGTIVTGRVVYDAFVLENKKYGIYYHPIAEDQQE